MLTRKIVDKLHGPSTSLHYGIMIDGVSWLGNERMAIAIKTDDVPRELRGLLPERADASGPGGWAEKDGARVELPDLAALLVTADTAATNLHDTGWIFEPQYCCDPVRRMLRADTGLLVAVDNYYFKLIDRCCHPSLITVHENRPIWFWSHGKLAAVLMPCTGRDITDIIVARNLMSGYGAVDNGGSL